MENAADIWKLIFDIDNREEQGIMTEDSSRSALKIDLQNLMLLEARKWRQLCKYAWFNEGGGSTAFLHEVCFARRQINFISEIQNTQGVNFYTDPLIEKDFKDYFNDIYIGESNVEWMFDNLDWESLFPNTCCKSH